MASLSPPTSPTSTISKESKSARSVRCNCGNVEFTVTGTDKLAVHCYCVNCQRSTGSAFAHNHRYSEAAITFKRGEEFVKQYADKNTDSGGIIFRHFCSNCGSPLFLKSNAVADFVAVHEGSTTEAKKSQPVLELFAQEKYAWIGDVKGEFSGPPPFPWDPAS